MNTKKALLLLISNILTASFCLAQNVSVSPLTGTANTAIPILSVSRGQVSIPITLTYASTGIKPKDVEGSAGMGWNLQAGGQISRQLRGLPDDCTAANNNGSELGWLYSGTASIINSFTIANTSNNCTNEGTDLTYINTNFSYNKDTEPDVFYASAPGLSCSFVFDGSQNIRLLSYQDLVITYTHNTGTGILHGAITSFTITNDQGIKYVFSAPDTVTQTAATSGSYVYITYFKNKFYQYVSGIEYFDNWHLTSISDANGNGFLLKYIPSKSRASTDSLNIFISTSDPEFAPPKFFQYCMNQKSGSQLLSAISPFDNNAPSGTGYPSQQVNLSWGYNSGSGQYVITGITGLGRNLQFGYNSVGYTRKGSHLSYNRYFLGTLSESGCSSPINYSFGYFGINQGKITLPDSLNCTDPWGYYNSAYNQSSVPSVYVNPSDPTNQRYEIYNSTAYGSQYSYLLSETLATADPDSVMTGSLTQINYPQGGNTTITYEINDYLDVPANAVAKGGGIRVKQVTDYDNINSANNITKTYTYVNPNTGLSSGKPISMPVLDFVTPMASPDNTISSWYYCSMFSQNDFSPEDHTIMYEYVKESQTGAGSTQYQYYIPATNWDSSATPSCSGCTTPEWAPTIDHTARASCSTNYGYVRNDIDTYPYAPNPNYDFERGLIKQVTTFNAAPTPQEVSEMDYTYQRTGSPLMINAFKFEDNTAPTNSNTYLTGLSVKAYAKYQLFTGVSELPATVVKKVFDSGTLSQAQTSTTKYTYNTTQHKLIKQQVTNSDNAVYTTNTSYVKDYTATGTNPDVVAIYNMQQQNINTPVETYQQVTRSGTTKTIGAALTRFQTLTSGGYTVTVPLQQLKFIAPTAVTNFTPYAITSGTPNPYSGYISSANYTAFDLTGTLQTADDNYKHVQTTLIDRVSNKPVALFANTQLSEIGYNDFDSSLPASSPMIQMASGALPNTSSGHAGYSYNFATTDTMKRTLTKNAAAKNYIFSTWVHYYSGPTTATLTITLTTSSGTVYTYPETLTNLGGWTYYEWKLPVANMTSTFTFKATTNQTITIDDILIYPDVAEATTYAYDKTAFYKVAQTNTNGVSAYYANDTWGRLIYAYDQDKNIIQKNSYATFTGASDFNALVIADPLKPVGGTQAYTQQPIGYTISGPCSADGISVNWDFGDGTTVTSAGLTSPLHTYTTAGTFTVKATVNSSVYGTKVAPNISVSVLIHPVSVGVSTSPWTSYFTNIIFSQSGVTKYTFTAAQLSGATVSPGVYTVTLNISAQAQHPLSGVGCNSINYNNNNESPQCITFTGSPSTVYSFTEDLTTATSFSVALSASSCAPQ